MQILYARCSGLDLHQKTVVACVLISHPTGKVEKHLPIFPTTIAGLRALSEWLASLQVTHVAMESTGIRLPSDLECVGRAVPTDLGQCPPDQSLARTQDRPQR